MTTNKTAAAQDEEVADVLKLISDAEALRTRATDELATCRRIFEELKPYQHEKMMMNTPYNFRGRDAPDKMPPHRVIETMIDRINAILGDRP